MPFHSDITMQKIYHAYVHSHDEFISREARSRILKVSNGVQMIDFSGIDAFSYNNLLKVLLAGKTDEYAIQHQIELEIAKLHGDLNDLAAHMSTAQYSKRSYVGGMLNSMCLIANEMQDLMNKLPTNIRFRNTHALKVQDVAQTILINETRLRRIAEQMRQRGPQFVTLVKPSGVTERIPEKLNLVGLYKYFLDGIEGVLGKTYEHLLTLYIGKMPQVVLTELSNWATNLANTYRSPRYNEFVSASITGVQLPREMRRSGQTTLSHIQRGTDGLIDWYVNEKQVGFDIQLTVSQKEYRLLERDSEVYLKAIGSKINGKVLQVAENVQQAYALYRAFSSPSSRGERNGTTKTVADTIVRQTLIDDIFGSGVDSVSDLLINRVFYSSAAIMKRLFEGNRFSTRSMSGADRVKIELGDGGTEGSHARDPRIKSALDNVRTTEYGAAGIWLTPSRLRDIQQSAFIVHWRFEKAWFPNVKTSF